VIRKVFKLSVAIVIALGVMEVVLQAGALVMYGLHRNPSHDSRIDDDGVLRILCVGDSFTFGDGASTPETSYPMALKRELQERLGSPVEVLNTGWPGNDSRDVLAFLDEHLRTFRPHVVVVLVGANDVWNRPELLTDPSTTRNSHGFNLRWRTARLVRLLLQDRRDAGRWDNAGTPSSSMIAAARRLIAEAGIHTAGRPGSPELSKRVRETRGRTWSAIDKRAYHAAIATLEAGIAVEDHPMLRALLVRTYGLSGDRERASTALDELRARTAEHPDRDHEIYLVEALWHAGRVEEAFALGREVVERYPDAPTGWRVLGQTGFRIDHEVAKLAFRRFVEVSGPVQPSLAWAVADLGRLLADESPEDATRLLHAGLLLSGSLAKHPFASYAISAKRIPAEMVKTQLDVADLDARGSSLLQAAYDDVYGGSASQWRQVLRRHLLSMGAMVRDSDAQAVFLSYPFFNHHEAVIRAAAMESGAKFVPVRERFDRELETHSRDELFVKDGHCNDTGYAIVADEVGEAILCFLGETGG